MYKVEEVACPLAPWGYYYYTWIERKRCRKEPFATLLSAVEYVTKLAMYTDTYIEQGGLG